MRFKRSLTIADRHDRLIKLNRSVECASPELAKKLAVAEQTRYRDVDLLEKRGYSIWAENHGDGWAYHLLAQPARVSDWNRSPSE